jgi:CRISPR-associated protein Csb2
LSYLYPTHAVLFSMVGPVSIPFQASLAVCEKLKTVFLGACGYHFGKFSIPEDFSSHSEEQLKLQNSNRHPYFLCLPDHSFRTIQYAMIFHRRNYTEEEMNVFNYIDSLIDFENGIAWKLQILIQGNLEEFTLQLPSGVRRFLEPSAIWHSVTPFLKTRHLRIKRSEKHDEHLRLDALEREISGNVSFELENHGFPPAVEIRMNRQHMLSPRDSGNHCSDFLKNRYKCKGSVMDYGHSITIRFEAPILGPVALGKNSHMGMGLFSSF